MTPRATLTVSPEVYRRHLMYPEILLTILAWSAEAITGESAEWEILEDPSSGLTADIDYELGYPAPQPFRESVRWQLSGCMTAALLTLRLTALCAEADVADGRG